MPATVLRAAIIICASVAVVLVAAAMWGERGWVRHERLRRELGALRAENESLEQGNRRLRRQTEALRHDEDFIEMTVRDELGWVRPDEKVFYFPPTPRAAGPASPSSIRAAPASSR